MHKISWEDFEKIEIRCGIILTAEPFPEAKKPAIKMEIDFGEALGVKRSSAQITRHYTSDELIGRQVVAVVNFPPKQIGPFISEVLVLGLESGEGGIVLVVPDKPVPNGGKVH